MLRAILILAITISLSACASGKGSYFSFAPPPVYVDFPTIKKCVSDDTQDQEQDQEEGEQQNRVCADSAGIKSNADAVKQLNTFIKIYRIAYRESANGRQAFEIPSFFSILGGVTATAFGGNPDAVLLGGAASAVFSGGKDYYAPEEKARLYNSAKGSLQCILRQATNGVPEQVVDLESLMAVGTKPAYNAVYSKLISSALQVEDKLSDKLLSAGSFESALSKVSAFEKVAQDKLAAQNKVKVSEGSTNDKKSNDGDSEEVSVAATKERKDLLERMQSELDACILLI